MNLLLRYRREILILIVLIGAYFILRLPNLTLQPIFADEAIYIRWAQVMKSEPTLRFLPLSDGKTPLFMWSMIPFFKFFEDPLFAGRFLSVLSGLITLLGVFALSWKVFGKRVALWASLIYVVVPYTIFFDRMALVDSLLSAFSIWSIFFAIWLAQKVRLDLAMILGFILGGGILTKTPGMLSLFLVPLSFLAFRRVGGDKYKLVRLVLFWGVAIGIALFMYNSLRLGPNFHLLSSRNADYVFSPLELIGRPLDPFIPHLKDMADWFPKLLGWPVILAGFVGIFGVIRERNKLRILVLLWALLPLLIEMAFLRTFTARYLLFTIPPLLVVAGYGVEKISNFNLSTSLGTRFPISNIVITWIILVALLLPNLYFNYLLLTNPQKAPLPREERIGYFEDWTAGYGFSEIAQFLMEKKKEGPVTVGTEGYFGTLPDGLYIYLDKAGIQVVPDQATVSAKLLDAAQTNQTFFVANKSRLLEYTKQLKLIKEYPKAQSPDGKQDAIQLFEVIPDAN
ncbi:MAG: glycosyltransferase family 39 protein [Candidatus Daviesbacteria bacterium]|nr:glycosyltransferase family 39 protein [Candidatus Daviesbacteria bacterium]